MKRRSTLLLLSLALTAGCSPSGERQGDDRQSAQSYGSIEGLDPALDDIVAPDAAVEKVAGGFEWTEGPLWVPGGYLLAAAIHRNSIVKWLPGEEVAVFLHPSGYQGATPYPGPEPGSNGMTLDPSGRLTVAGHARRAVYRLESLDSGAPATILVDRYQGKRLNSPNDVAYRSDGSLYFTDPPYGLPTQGDDDPLKELPFNGVYRLPGAASIPAGSDPTDRALQLVIDDLTRPNGLVFSPDESYLYVSVSDPNRMVWMRYEVQADGSVANGMVFATATADQGIGGPDGIKVDREGNLYGSGPGGLWILSPAGRHLGTVTLPERASNCAWGDADGRTLYITASSSFYRVRMKIPGVGP